MGKFWGLLTMVFDSDSKRKRLQPNNILRPIFAWRCPLVLSPWQDPGTVTWYGAGGDSLHWLRGWGTCWETLSFMQLHGRGGKGVSTSLCLDLTCSNYKKPNRFTQSQAVPDLTKCLNFPKYFFNCENNYGFLCYSMVSLYAKQRIRGTFQSAHRKIISRAYGITAHILTHKSTRPC